jgi:hypothetical protein
MCLFGHCLAKILATAKGFTTLRGFIAVDMAQCGAGGEEKEV